jgi:hypothetical protein
MAGAGRWWARRQHARGCRAARASLAELAPDRLQPIASHLTPPGPLGRPAGTGYSHYAHNPSCHANATLVINYPIALEELCTFNLPRQLTAATKGQRDSAFGTDTGGWQASGLYPLDAECAAACALARERPALHA